MIKNIIYYIKKKTVNCFYDFKKLIKLMGTNLKENIIWCNN